MRIFTQILFDCGNLYTTLTLLNKSVIHNGPRMNNSHPRYQVLNIRFSIVGIFFFNVGYFLVIILQLLYSEFNEA